MGQLINNTDSGLVARTKINEQVNNWFNVEQYGAVHDDTTDDTGAIQAAINAAFSAGGGTVYFPNGVYKIAGSLITSLDSVNPNCQLYFPLSTDTFVYIKLLGEMPCAYFDGPLLDETAVWDLTTGVILHSTITGSGTLPSVLANSFFDYGYGNTNFTSPIIENISIMVYTDAAGTPVAPTMSAFNLNMNISKQLKNCFAFTESSVYDAVLPSAVTYGFYLSRGGLYDCNSNYEMISAFSFYYGVRMEEHDTWDKINVVGCLHGVAFGNTGVRHAMFGGVIHAYGCKYGVTFLGDCHVNFRYYCERYTTAQRTVWYNGTADFYIPSTKVLTGRIEAGAIISGGTLSTPIVSGSYTGNMSVIDSYNNAETIGVDGKKIQTYTTNTGYQNTIKNLSTGTSAYVSWQAHNATHLMALGMSSTGLTPAGNINADNCYLLTDGAAGFVAWLSSASTPSYRIGFGASNTIKFNLISAGRLFLNGSTAPTATLHLAAGAAAASGAPLKFTSGTNLTTGEAGAMEYNGTNLFFTRSGTARENVVCASAVNSVSPTAPNRTLTVNIDGTTYYVHAKTTND